MLEDTVMDADPTLMKTIKRNSLILYFIQCPLSVQVYFVLGGRTGALNVESSEFYVVGDSMWTLYNGLNPSSSLIKTVVLDNRIFSTGIFHCKDL